MVGVTAGEGWRWVGSNTLRCGSNEDEGQGEAAWPHQFCGT
jgi:hypothetical protein